MTWIAWFWHFHFKNAHYSVWYLLYIASCVLWTGNENGLPHLKLLQKSKFLKYKLLFRRFCMFTLQTRNIILLVAQQLQGQGFIHRQLIFRQWHFRLVQVQSPFLVSGCRGLLFFRPLWRLPFLFRPEQIKIEMLLSIYGRDLNTGFWKQV